MGLAVGLGVGFGLGFGLAVTTIAGSELGVRDGVRVGLAVGHAMSVEPGVGAFEDGGGDSVFDAGGFCAAVGLAATALTDAVGVDVVACVASSSVVALSDGDGVGVSKGVGANGWSAPTVTACDEAM